MSQLILKLIVIWFSKSSNQKTGIHRTVSAIVYFHIKLILSNHTHTHTHTTVQGAEQNKIPYANKHLPPRHCNLLQLNEKWHQDGTDLW